MRNELIAAVFPSRSTLTKALDHVMALDDLKIQRAAVISKAQSGETTVVGDDISPDEGAIAGGTLGAAMTALGLAQMGALALPGAGVIIALGAGVLVGGLLGAFTGRLAVNLLDSGVRHHQVQALADFLHSGHSAIVFELPVHPDNLKRLRDELADYRVMAVELWSDFNANAHSTH